MYNQHEFLDASGNLDHEAVRAHFLRAGKLDGLFKGDTVYIDAGQRWELVRLVRRLPGDVWTAKYLERSNSEPKTIVMCSNFGGRYYL
jgi:hypothetical protein